MHNPIPKAYRKYVPGQLYLIIFIVLFSALGMYFVYISQATTPAVSVEPEQGTVTNGATIVTGDSLASNSQYIKFSSPVVPPPASSGWKPFTADSPWNTPIPATATWRDEAKLRANPWWINLESFSIPVIHSQPTDPAVAVAVPATWGWPAGPVSVRVPSGITGAAGSDGTLSIITGDIVCDFWQFNRTSTNAASASAYACSNTVSGTGFGTSSPFKAAGIRAAGSSAVGGLLVGQHFSEMKINHALAVSLLGTILKRGWVAPAISEDTGTIYSGTIPIGSRLGIPASTPAPAGLSATGLMVWDALKTYGAYVVDQHTGSSPVILYGDPRSVTPAQVNPLRNGTPSDLSKIMPSVRVMQ
jgi:hypothetical protein